MQVGCATITAHLGPARFSCSHPEGVSQPIAAPPCRGPATRGASGSPRTVAVVSAASQAVIEDRSALLDEYRELAYSIAAQRERAERLRGLADQATAHAEEQERSLQELAELLGIDPQLRLEDLDSRLRGQRLQEIAIAVLSERHADGEPIHYKQWYALLREAGYAVGGKDPLATFLASVSRSSRVRSVGRRSGLYVIAGADAPATS